MKKQTRLFFVLACLVVTGCGHRGNTNITFNESGPYFSMIASFHKSKTEEVEKYMDQELRSLTGKSFRNTNFDADLSFDNRLNFYIKKYDGFLKIKMNRHENSRESYQKVRAMCEGIKKILGE